MKKFLLLCGCLLVITGNGTMAQSTPNKDVQGSIYYGQPKSAGNISESKNYIRTYTYCNDQGLSMTSMSYFDGIGRKCQELRKGASTNGMDVVTHLEYDASGREATAWLPVRGRGNGAFVSKSDIQSDAASLYGDTQAFTRTKYTPGISNRVAAVCGPGSQWHSQGKSVRTEYTSCSNQQNDSLCCRKYVVSGTTLKKQGNYSAAGLHVEKYFDEDNHVSLVFKNSRDQVILERSYESDSGTPLDTYYVYDVHGNLCWVLPPAAADLLGADGTYTATTMAIARYGYIYRYDERQRVIERKLPGCEPEYLVSDKAGRPVLTQDGNLRAEGKWRYTYYTAFGEVAETGICKLSSPLSIDALRAQVDAAYGKATYVSGTGYIYSSLPVTDRVPEIVNYYDTFNFLSLPGFSGDTALTSCPIDCRGKLTGSMTAVYGTDTKLYSVFHYDVKGRMVKSVSTNLLGGHEMVNTTYTFTGSPQRLEKIHSTVSSGTVSEVYLYSYDNWGKLLKTEHEFGGHTTTLSSQTYDAVERLSRKTLGDHLESLSYEYNVRGWLSGIQSGKFSQTLHYTNGVGTPCYNGNISSMTWTTSAAPSIRGYRFEYDQLSRLKNAAYGEGEGLSLNTNRFNEQVSGYDKQGNILGLQRYGQTGESVYGLVDDLTMIYEGNQLKSVSDTVSGSVYANGFDFRDGANLSVEYCYDANGNLTQDLNKKIVEIKYNWLNLPSCVTFENGNSVSYVYDAKGTKLRATHVIGNDSTVTDYCGNVIYENGVAKTLLTEAGYITLSDNKYHYYIQDHQGNNRVVIDQDGNVEEVNDYYPFGGLLSSSVSNAVQPYKYNGKELDRKNGLDWYDYGARMYDAALGRWHAVDPMSEKYYSWSPYIYCANNPIRYVDPIGMDWYESNNGAILWTDYTSQEELDDNDIRGRYLGQAHVVFSGSRYEKLGIKNGGEGYIDGEGAVTANVTVYGPDGKDDITSLTGFTMTSDVEQYGAISEGLFNANYDSKGKSGALKSNWTLNNRGEIPTMDNEPNLSPYADANYGKPVKTGIFIHSTNNSGYAGKTVSTGCLLLAPQDFRTFNTEMSGVRKFTVRITREQTVKVPLQGVTGIVPNLFIQKTIIRR